MQLHIRTRKPEHREFLHHVDKARHTGDQLRDAGCNRRALHAHIQAFDAENVQPDIQNAANDQEVQRRFAVAERANDRCEQVIHHLRADAHENPHQIIVRKAHQLFRNVHPDQNLLRKWHGDRGHQNREHDSDPHDIRHAPLYPRRILRAKVLCNWNGKARA